MKLKIKAYMSKEDFFKLPSAEQRKKAEKYDVYKKYLKEGKSKSKQANSAKQTKDSSDAIKKAQEKLDNALAELAWYKKEKSDYAGMDKYEKEQFKEEYDLAKYDVDMAKQELNELKNKKSKKPQLSEKAKKAVDDMLATGAWEPEKLKDSMSSVLKKHPELKQAFEAAKPELKQLLSAVDKFEKIKKAEDKHREKGRKLEDAGYEDSKDPKKKQVWNEHCKEHKALWKAHDAAFNEQEKCRRAWSKKLLKDLPYKNAYYTG